MEDSVVLQVTFPTGIVKEYFPVLHPDVAVDVQAAELRKYIYRRLATARHISVEVRLESGDTGQQIIPIEQLGAVAVLVRKTAPLDPEAFRVEPHHVRREGYAGHPHPG